MYWLGMIVGFILGILAMKLAMTVKVRYYEWILMLITVVTGVFAVQHYFGSIAEDEHKSAWMGLLVFGLLTVALAAETFQLIWRHRHTS